MPDEWLDDNGTRHWIDEGGREHVDLTAEQTLTLTIEDMVSVATDEPTTEGE